MLKGEFIWQGDEKALDTYVDFRGSFSAENNKKIFLKIACDSNYNFYINGILAAFSGCADFPEHKLYDKVDITRFCGLQNYFSITVWHYGKDSQTYINADGGLLFEIIQNGKVLEKSGSHILSRINKNYLNGYDKKITDQLGQSFFFDANAKSAEFLPSRVVKACSAQLRKTAPIKLLERKPITVTEFDDGILIDSGMETVGFLDLEFNCGEECDLLISYSEHLVDGKVPRFIGGRDFSVEYRAKKGYNSYLNAFRRLAGRYLFVQLNKKIDIIYMGIRPVDYPIVEIKRKFKDKFLQRVYDVSVYTLKCCMHEHYEDCPWREQALYTMDSRNQMLCGYYAFKGFAYQRANLIYLARAARKDGLISLCAPAGLDLPIPFFSLVYPLQVWEYTLYSKDLTLLDEVKGVIKNIMSAFENRIDENGLIPNFGKEYWNFYEWSDFSWGEKRDDEKRYDLILNCMYVYSKRICDKMFNEQSDLSMVTNAIEKTFFNAEKGFYKLSTDGENYSRLGNSFALLIGLKGNDFAERLIADKSLVEITLSMNTFYYDALIETDEKFIDLVLNDIKRKYKYMLDDGATTFWETEKGYFDFDMAGSLCHGWSAMPVYYLCKYVL